jgi:peptidoglycan glycosyltransferase
MEVKPVNKAIKRSYALYFLIFAFLAGVGILIYSFIMHGQTWATNRANKHIYNAGQIATAGTIYDRNGEILAKTVDSVRKFNENQTVRKATLHVVGDSAGFISTGIHSVYKSELTGYSLIDGVYKLKEYGMGNDIKLTIDAQACKVAYKALGNYKGTIGVFNYKTGEILCMVSAPSYDPENVPDDIDDEEKYEGVYLNRFISGVYTPGSTFKVITSACAIENIPDIFSRTFTCEGKYKTPYGEIKCRSAHGKVDFEEALNKSCNSAFAQIAIELGPEKLTQMANALGFNSAFKLGSIIVAKSTFNVEKTNDCDLGWAGIGQYTTLANPFHMMMIMGAIANGGECVTPYLVGSIINPSGIERSTSKDKICLTIDGSTAQKLKMMLRSNVKNSYGDSRFSGLEMCGKTGTAEVEGDEPHSWFVGFSSREDLPLAVVAVVENAGSGSGAAMTAANKVMQQLAKIFD